MRIQSSILAGEILLVLENSACSVRIVDIESILQTSKKDTHLAVARLLSEELVDLIKEDQQSALVLTHHAEMPDENYYENNMPAPVMAFE